MIELGAIPALRFIFCPAGQKDAASIRARFILQMTTFKTKFYICTRFSI